MIKLRHTASALALSTLIAFGACKKKEDVGNVADVKVEAADASIIKKLLEVDDRTVSDAEAQSALEAMGLTESSANWDSVEGSGGDYHYKGLSFTSDDGASVTIKDVKFDGVHMEGEDPSFDRISISGVDINDEDATVSLGGLTISRPHPEVAGAILEAVANLDSLDGMDMDFDLDGEAPFVYDWSHLPGNDDPEDVMNLSVGDYVLTVTDAQACSSSMKSGRRIVPVHVPPPTTVNS